MRLFTAIRNRLLFPIAYIILTIKSLINSIKSRQHPPVVHFERPYQGEKIMLLALYEKGLPRPDIRMLLETAKAQGAYVLAVNTMTFTEPAAWRSLIDCYIEKHNFGRDFSSYQAGFLHLYARGWEATCPRLLMLNDSVFYCSQRTPKFVADLFGSEVEALGATENFEIEHHLGSFCIAMAGRVVAHQRMKRYWQSYRNTDIRPKVIARGEMKLSKTLKRVVASEDQFRALYSVARFAEAVRGDPEYLARALDHARESILVRWPTTRAKDVLRDFKARYTLLAGTELADEFRPLYDDGKLTVEEYAKLTRRDQPSLAPPADRDIQEYGIFDLDGLLKTATTHITSDAEKAIPLIREMVADRMIANFIRGSHIHQNAAALVHLGLAIVKLDGMYRGMFSPADVRKICNLMSEEDSRALERLLLSRPFGDYNMDGWRQAAFRQGLL
jgi:hypothetical protein